ncbi:MAG TPA: Stp1/IreP family PP2C-type Ser/Thr phosphatase [Deinococcales bacterium]|nr:Stp1/IreP family PP2C-type Ser/Thr phosphatase [Deinococcales bacterium]
MDSGPEGEPQGRQGSLELAGLTDTGRARSVNEDSWTRADIGAVTLIVVADGMGGHQAGEVASGLAVQQIPKAYAEAAGDPPARLARAFEVANRAVHEHSRRRPDARGMGTTVTAAVLDGPNLVIGHAGDSRAYLWREGALRQLTRDHSWVAERVRSGVLSEEEARTHRWRSVITNALGSFPRVRLDLFGLTLQAGDTLLLCSDGLDAVLNDEEIAAVLERTAPQPAENAARELVRLANEGGGPDNITVALV